MTSCFKLLLGGCPYHNGLMFELSAEINIFFCLSSFHWDIFLQQQDKQLINEAGTRK